MTAQEEETPAFSAVSKMEDAVTAARDYANLLMRLDDDTFENAEAACAVKRIAEHLRDHVDEIENLRGDLFRLLHPRRAEFEASGWPDDEAEAA